MIKRCVALALSVLLLVGALCGCAGEKSEGTYLTFTDSTGERVALDARPVRVAVLFSSFAEMWTLAGGEVSVSVGESVERGFCDSDTPLVDSGAGKTVNTELLVAQKPDLVIGSADVEAQVRAAELMRELGIPCALFRVESFSDYLQVLKIMTDITGDRAAYQTHGLAVKAEIDALLAELPTDAEQEILFIRAGSSRSSTRAKGSEMHFAAAMLRELGCTNVADNAPVLLDGLSVEEILRADPDAIFVSTMGDAERARASMESILREETWQSLSAVRAGRVYYLPKELFQFKPNARWGEAYRMLAEIVYGKADETDE